MKTQEQVREYRKAYMRRYRMPGFAARVAQGQDLEKAKLRAEKYRKSPKGKATKKVWKSTDVQREKARIGAHLLRGMPPPTRVMPECCESCGGPPNGRGILHLDHCYETGIFRGWLCFKCNSGIGNLGDSIEGLEKALVYLRQAYSITSTEVI